MLSRSPLGFAALAAVAASSLAGAAIVARPAAKREERRPFKADDVGAVKVIDPEPDQLSDNSGKLEHVRLVRQTDKVAGAAQAAADRVHGKGGSPRAQIDAARKASGQKLNYMPHQGLKERQRRLKRLAAGGDVPLG